MKWSVIVLAWWFMTFTEGRGIFFKTPTFVTHGPFGSQEQCEIMRKWTQLIYEFAKPGPCWLN